ncbi:MAG: nucleotidyltransferase family protein [Chloroflexi bacterium]|nr:nucleotidyltransferase family protein [Chloroflexota bacterium]
MLPVSIPYHELDSLCAEYHIVRIRLFGSVLRTDFRPDSDVDILVDFAPDAHTTLLDLSAVQRQLEQMLGRQVDLGTPDGLSPYIRERVLQTAQVIYERRE